MATWVVHLRVADEYIKRGLIPYPKEFSMGSVAPDCGYGEKDSNGEFSPPPEITHWAPGGIKKYCEYKKFASAFLTGRKDSAARYFYLGYYIHLITDIMWSTMIYEPTVESCKKEFEKDPNYLSVIKRDWYDLDFKFLRDHPAFAPYSHLKHTENTPDYLPYYEHGQLAHQLRYIYDYYKNAGGRVLDREYPHLGENAMADFIRNATELIDFDLEKKGLLDISGTQRSDKKVSRIA